MRAVDVCVFAHDEAATIAGVVAALAGQTLLRDPTWDARVAIMANGCRDDTVARARAAVSALNPATAARFAVIDLTEGGKSRTWNVFTHETARAEAALMIYIDADVRLIAPETLARLADALAARPALRVFSSRPVKDLNHDVAASGLVARLIAQAGGGLDDFRTAVCGQLYAIRPEAARMVWMPVGLPVEDGFLRAMVLTDLLTAPEDLSRIDGDPEIFHVYESIRAVGPLIRHQTRIVIGGAVNFALFGLLRREAPDLPRAEALLRAAAADPAWLGRALRRELPQWPFGWAPFHFAVKRLRTPRRPGARGLALLAVGLAFDAVVWANATLRMARGAGAGYW